MTKNLSFNLAVRLAMVVLCSGAAGATAQTERVVYSFAGAPNGAGPLGGLAVDSHDRSYGIAGGGSGCGIVFELKQPASRVLESVIWTFGSAGASDGCYPNSGLIIDPSGNLYGTTSGGGERGSGAVFELSPDGSGGWTEKILWSFGGVYGNVQDGMTPVAGLTMDTAGNLYGTTLYGGGAPPSGGCGTVFEVSPNPDGSWSEALLHAFTFCDSSGGDGIQPFTGVTLDSAGNVYGTTNLGGYENTATCGFGCGTVFELEKAAGWKETQIYLFQGGTDGANPYGPVIFASAGHLLGTARFGGFGSGVAFELVKAASGWQQSVLHSFGYPEGDGVGPNGGLAARENHYYGTTQGIWEPVGPGCGFYSCGTVYELTPSGAGWTYSILHTFGSGNDGSFGAGYGAGVTVGPAGSIYGATNSGGANDLGAIFEITP